MPAKKPRQQRKLNMETSDKQDQLALDFSDPNDVVSTTSSMYDPSLGSISIDTNSWLQYNMATSITSPCVVTYNPSTTPTWTTSGTSYTLSNSYNTSSTVQIDGDGLTMKAGADIKIGEKSLIDILDKIEERLAILKVNSELEHKWERLKELGDEYRALEKDLLEKEKIIDILKKK